MSQTKTSLNNFLSSKKFTKKERRSISRSLSERSLGEIKSSQVKKFSIHNAEENSPRKFKNYEDDEEMYYDQRQSKLQLKKKNSVESSGEFYTRTNKKYRREEERD
jgi:hypothetical protein